MQLRKIMTEGVITVTEDTIAEDAYHKMSTNEVHHLVVVRGHDVVGVLSERDLGGKSGFDMCAGKQVKDFVSTDIVTASPDETVQDAALLLRGYNIGCLPVVDEGKLVGIVTISDLLDFVGKGAPVGG